MAHAKRKDAKEKLRMRNLGVFACVWWDGVAFGFHEQGEPTTLAESRACSPAAMGTAATRKETAEAADRRGRLGPIVFTWSNSGSASSASRMAGS